jgi:hypothetical protein
MAFLSKLTLIKQRLLDLRLSRIHQLNQGEALVVEMAVAR